MNSYKHDLYFLFFLIISFCSVCQAETIDIGSTTFSSTLLNVGGGESMISTFDFNSDGHEDIIVANYSENNLVAYQGDGKGNLIEISRHSAGERPTGMSVFDINSDGHIDVIIANHETSYVTLLYGDGRGGFKNAPHSPIDINSQPHPHVVQLKDLDGDEKVDLIVDSRTHNGLRVLIGNGDGTFKKQEQLIDVGGDPYHGFATGDINGDGKLDLVTPNQNDVGIVLSAAGDKLSYSITRLTPFKSPFAVELADLTGDGQLDLIGASSGNLITVIPGDDQGNFLEEKRTTLKTAAGAKQIAVGDINGDGIKDALISNWSGAILAVLGSKSAIESKAFEHPSIPNPWGLVITDLNNDGKSDFIIAGGDSKLAAVYLSQSK